MNDWFTEFKGRNSSATEISYKNMHMNRSSIIFKQGQNHELLQISLFPDAAHQKIQLIHEKNVSILHAGRWSRTYRSSPWYVLVTS